MEPKKANDPDELGRWRIMGRLGEGGFGTVFLAESGAQKAAVKVLKSDIADDIDARANLAKEAEVLSGLIDPAIGKIIDSDLNGEPAWIATEFINGPTLDSKVKYEGPLDEHAWFNLAATLFHALVTAHEFGVIHKDVKPSNIILGETGTKLIDFGIAYVAGQLTRTTTLSGREGSTPFSAPEHFTPKSYPEMDVFSAAVTLAYAGKASSIWSGLTELQLMRNINEDEPDLTGLQSNQIEFLLPLLNKNPSDRPSSKDALEMALKYLEQYSSDNPIKTFDAWAKRRKPAKSGFSRVSVALIGSAVLSITALTAYALTNHQPSVAPPNSITTVVASPSASASGSLLVGKSTSADCEDAYVNNKNAVSEKCLQPANSGDLRSIYYMGKDALDNRKLAVAESWFLKAAKKDDVSSMGELAQVYLDTKQTAKYSVWVKKCADYGVKSTAGARCKLLYGMDLLSKNETNDSFSCRHYFEMILEDTLDRRDFSENWEYQERLYNKRTFPRMDEVVGTNLILNKYIKGKDVYCLGMRMHTADELATLQIARSMSIFLHPEQVGKIQPHSGKGVQPIFYVPKNGETIQRLVIRTLLDKYDIENHPKGITCHP